ncbi:MAG: FHA domain-containing protein [Bdellovibrionaceae bacterium]|nr:FHA domain-containing protein [Pseudobdellovibrionaceae bacterium]
MSKPDRVFILDLTSLAGMKTHHVEQSKFVLGRGPSSAIKIDDINISREHIEIFYDEVVKIKDLNSSNGTFVNGTKIDSGIDYALGDNDIVTLGRSDVCFRVRTFQPVGEGKQVLEKSNLKPEEKNAQIKVKISGLPSPEQEIKLDFKNAKIDIPKYRDASEHAREILTEANYVKQSILKSALVQKEKILNEAALQAKSVADKSYEEYRERLDLVIAETKSQMQYLKTETEMHLDDKKLHTMTEIEHLWKAHQDQIEIDKKITLLKLRDQNKHDMDIEFERLNNELFIEKNRMLTDSESVVMRNTVEYRARFENERTEHEEKVRLLVKQIEDLKEEDDTCTRKVKELKEGLHTNQMDYDKVLSQLNIENDRLEVVQKKHNTLESENLKLQESLDSYTKNRDAILETERQTKKTAEEILLRVTELSQKKEELQGLVQNLEVTLAESKLKAKANVENEYIALRLDANKKFEGLKVAELKELQKIRLEHTTSFKKFSLDMSQEIAVKLEMLQKRSPEFSFEKNLEVINSVIQIKSAEVTGVESNHQDQLDSWKRKHKSEKIRQFMYGAMASVLLYVSGTFVYSRFSIDSLKQELQRTAELRREKEIENAFVPTKTNVFYESYVDATIYTQNFTDVYLDDSLQNEWVQVATRYFVHTWKIDEQKTIQVIANSKSLVQSIDEASKKLTKTKLKSELEKLKSLETDNVEAQVAILGTNVKYEAFKKLEKKFFTEKLQKRGTASQ